MELIKHKNKWYIKSATGYREVLATTDKSLIIYNESDYIKSSPYVKYLPQPSQAFIEKYCKKGGIDEVSVEYGGNTVEFQNFCSDLGFSYDSAFGWYENANPGHRPNTSTLEEKFNNKLKVDSHNTITIHPIKDNWNRKETKELMWLTWKASNIIFEDEIALKEEFESWYNTKGKNL